MKDDLQFYGHFNLFHHTEPREGLCAMEPCFSVEKSST